jgi:uncharacterized protein
MMSAHARLLVLCGVLIAALAASLTAFVLARPRADAVTAPPAQALMLAASTSGNTITVVGVGNGSAVPDRANLELGVSATRSSVRDAVSAASTDMSHLMSALHGQGVENKNVATSSIYVQQQTTCCPQNITCYTASEGVQVTVTHLTNVTSLTEAAVDAVGNDLQLNGINLFVNDQGGMLKSARSAAMSDAGAKAQDYARLSGHHLGGLVGVSEVISTTGGFACDSCGGKGAGGGGGFQVSPGTQTVTVTVAVTYELAS